MPGRVPPPAERFRKLADTADEAFRRDSYPWFRRCIRGLGGGSGSGRRRKSADHQIRLTELRICEHSCAQTSLRAGTS